MIRVRIALGILAGLILLSTTSAFIVNHNCDKVNSVLHMAGIAHSMNDNERAAELCAEAYESFQDSQSLLAFCVSYEKLSEADRALCRLAPLLRDDCDEFSAELVSAEKLLIHMADSELPHLS